MQPRHRPHQEHELLGHLPLLPEGAIQLLQGYDHDVPHHTSTSTMVVLHKLDLQDHRVSHAQSRSLPVEVEEILVGPT